jgi:hypothetical protein
LEGGRGKVLQFRVECVQAIRSTYLPVPPARLFTAASHSDLLNYSTTHSHLRFGAISTHYPGKNRGQNACSGSTMPGRRWSEPGRATHGSGNLLQHPSLGPTSGGQTLRNLLACAFILADLGWCCWCDGASTHPGFPAREGHVPSWPMRPRWCLWVVSRLLRSPPT